MVCIEYCLLLAGTLLFDEKAAKMLLFFGLDCGMLEFFTHEPQSKEQLMSLSIFGARFSGKDSRLSTCKP
jgi:hypothetical protein